MKAARAAAAALSPWLAFAAGLACPPGATAQQKDHQPDATQVIAPARLDALLAELDELFAKADVSGYLARFEPDHEGALAMFGEHLAHLSQCTRSTKRESRVVTPPRVVGDRVLLRLRHVVHWGAAAAGERAREPFVEDSYLVVRRAEQDRLVPTFAIEMPAQTPCVRDGKFRCPPCNYEIGGLDGWLCVPLSRDRALTFESATFYLLGTDVACDLSVRVEAEPTPARTAALRLVNAFARIEPDADVAPPEHWTPPMHAASPPPGLDGCRVEVVLPHDQPQRDGGRAVFHVLTFGGLQHLLLLRGSQRSLQQHRAEVDALFASYMLLEKNCDAAELALEALRHHLGGVLDGATYRNERYDVVVHGPDGWRAEQRMGGAAFRVRWQGPGASTLWLVGHAVPVGMSAWTTETADLWLRRACTAKDLRVVDGAADGASAWQVVDPAAGPDGGMRRTVQLENIGHDDPAAPQVRVITVQLHPDLLLMLDGYGATPADERAIEQAIESLRRD